MSLIKDFNDLHIGTKGTLLNISSTVPFFFIGTYLFNPELIAKIQENPLTDIDFYFLLSICIALSILWFFMNFTISTVVIDFADWIERVREEDESKDEIHEESQISSESKMEGEEIKNSEDEEDLAGIFIISYIYSIGYLALAIFLNIWIGLLYKWFVLACFGFIVFRLLWVAVWCGVFKKVVKKSNGKVDRQNI